ncbi:MAG TPA: FIVAR domain-containing protein, partial [Candidatus Mediterraneibacter caccavium]|nr:FIVAR domain-containing protein [Candidatus Mediterraneibacter caccavium]
HTIQNGGVTEYTVSVSTDGEKWTEVASGTVDANAYKQGQNVRVDARFAPADAKYVKFTVEGAVGRIESEDDMYGRIAEMDLYGTTKADKTALNNLIAEVNALDPNDYTEESWATLSEALKAANAVATDNSVTTTQVKDAYDALAAAKEALVETTEPGPTPEDPREELAVLVGQMSGVQNDNYTTESWGAFQAQIEDAIAILQDASATDEDVQAMIDALNAAYTGLVKDGKAELGSVIDQMEKVEKGNYTDTSWNAFQAKLAEAKAMLDAGTATNDEMLAMAQALQAAYDNLVKKDDGQPGKPGTGTGGSTDGDKAVQTGDTAVPAGLLAVLAISGGAVVVLARRKKVR